MKQLRLCSSMSHGGGKLRGWSCIGGNLVAAGTPASSAVLGLFSLGAPAMLCGYVRVGSSPLKCALAARLADLKRFTADRRVGMTI
jgi:hypothetical protein